MEPRQLIDVPRPREPRTHRDAGRNPWLRTVLIALQVVAVVLVPYCAFVGFGMGSTYLPTAAERYDDALGTTLFHRSLWAALLLILAMVTGHTNPGRRTMVSTALTTLFTTVAAVIAGASLLAARRAEPHALDPERVALAGFPAPVGATRGRVVSRDDSTYFELETYYTVPGTEQAICPSAVRSFGGWATVVAQLTDYTQPRNRYTRDGDHLAEHAHLECYGVGDRTRIELRLSRYR